MKVVEVILLSFGLLVNTPSKALAQSTSPPSASIDAIKKLDFLLGSWKGDGWIQMGAGNRRNFNQSEVVESKLGGLVIMIEGLGKGSDADNNGAIVHNAIAIISYDSDAKVYRWRAYTADGRSIDTEAKLTGDHILQWGFAVPQAGTIRYTMDLSQPDHWHETGEFSHDGKSWFNTFEMMLQRSK